MTMEAKQDSELLVNAVLPFAERMLREYGEFHPCGGYMTLEGRIVDVGADKDGEDYPRSKDLLAALRKSFRSLARARECKAVALVFNVTITIPGSDRKSDAIQVFVDHSDGYSADIFYPYELVDGEVCYGEMFAQAGNHEIFSLN
jgi:hypothetical protein